MKAFLKGNEGMLCPLGPKVTTVGREGCDIIIQLPGVDAQHAIIEFHEQEECWVIQDLNTAQGTYVNDCRIQNATVRIQVGDIIRFGYNGSPYEFQVEATQNTYSTARRGTPLVLYPSVQHRPVSAWTQPITVIDQSQYATQQQTSTNLPYLATSSSTAPSSVTWTGATQNPLPRPPLRSRPLSAGATAARRGPCDMRFAGVTGPPVGGPLPRNTGGGWMGGTQTRYPPPPAPSQGAAQYGDLLQAMQDKEQKLLQLTEENSRLRLSEFDTYRKDQLIQQLQQENGSLRTQLHQEPSVIMGGDTDVSAKLLVLEAEVNSKKDEIAALREQLNNLKSESSNNPLVLKQELEEKIKELNNVRNELERIKKDKNITSGLVTQMQRDMSSKDSSISKLTREIETLKKELRDRDVQVTTLSNRMSKMRDNAASNNGKVEEDRPDARQKELLGLRQKFKTAENKISEQHDLIASLREELDKTKQSLFEEKDVHRRLQTEVDTARSQYLDMQRTERVVRVDMEQATKRLERFRNRVIQVTFSTPGIKAPEAEITDDELIDTMKKLIDERTSLTNKIKELKEQVRVAKSNNSELLANGTKLKEKILESLQRLKDEGRLSHQLKQEVTFLGSLSTDESLQWVQDLVIQGLTDEQTWETDTEAALEKCGVNVKLTNDTPASHINLLYAKWDSAIGEKERLSNQITEMEERHRVELKLQLDIEKEEMKGKLVDAVEKARLEGEENLNRAIDEITSVETEKRENALEAERKKILELESNLEALRQSLTSREDEEKEKLEAASKALAEMASYQALESELRDQIATIQKTTEEEIARLQAEKEDMAKKFAEETTSFKEQVKQHSVTICTMEERVVKVTKINKDYQEELGRLKKALSESEHKLNKPLLPPKPKVVIQRNTDELAAMEHVISVLRRENSEIKKQFKESQDVIMGLRRDLAGASARLSDITGELSESQKQDIEHKRELLSRKEKELVELRQQLAKLSTIVDKQKEEIGKMEAELSKEKSLSSKLRTGLDERTQQLEEFEVRLGEEKEEQKKQLDLLDQEGRITSELSALGSQCRGERHEQVITRQREALSELRQRIKILEVARPPLPTQDQALQQVIALKKELAEMRVNQAIAEDHVLQSATSLDREIGKARGLISPSNLAADMERSAHRETMDALEYSETTYLSLLRAMASVLEMESVEGLRSMAHLPRDERERLTKEREQSCEIIAQKINVLKDRVERKEELLNGYEQDLGKLRKAQEVAAKKSQQLDNMADDVRRHQEESVLLRESLNRTRDRLNQEKRLNTSIKQKKTFHLENERAHLMPRPSSGRKTDDHKAQARRKAQKELMHRKNYEINILKQELNEKQMDILDRERRMYTMESSLGIDKPVEVEVQREAEVN